MNQRVPYDFITDKLQQTAFHNVETLWEQMQQKLDQEMPVKKDERWRLLFWQLFSTVVLIVSISLIYINSSLNTHTDKLITVQLKKERNTKNISTAIKADKHVSNSIEVNNQLSMHVKKVTAHNKQTFNNQIPVLSSQNFITVKRETLVPAKATIALDLSTLSVTETTKEVKSISNNSESLQARSIEIADNQLIDNRIKQIELRLMSSFNYKGFDSAQRQSLVTVLPKINSSTKKKGWVAGVSLNYHLPLSHQEMSTVNMNGKQNVLFDYLPSIYLQYHFSEKWYLSSELGWINPQYTPNLSLLDKYTKVSNSQQKETEVSLNKLYYLNIPLSIHYQISSHLFVGWGIEYSYLKRSILTNEQCSWEQQGSNWVMTNETKSISVNANPHALAKKNNSNSNGTPVTPVDSVAESFRSHDWRALVDINYQYHRFELGMNFAMGLTPYIQIQSGSNTGFIKDRNEALLVYLHYNLFDQRRKH